VIDVDRVTAVDDAHGHEVDATTVRAVAARLAARAQVVDDLTVSVGVAPLDDLDPDGFALFHRAATALDAAKAAGRDRTMAAGPA
jgi:GGDEF domain-containing protein